jgi:Spy/CpxP family protein refolding chaperone
MKPVKAFAMLAVIGGALIALGSTNTAMGMGFNHHPGFGNMSSAHKFSPQVRKLAKILDLTTAQETQVQAIFTAEELTAKPLKQKIESDYSQIAAAVIVIPFDEGAVTTLANQLGADIASLVASEAQAESQIYALLTPEQQTQFVKIRDLFRSIF